MLSSRSMNTWLIRLALAAPLAALLAFGSDVLVWTNPAGRSLLEWTLTLIGYLGLSAVLLDLLVRYSVRDIFGVMLLAGVYGLLASLLLHPQSALADVPRTLVTRVMGLHTFAGMFALGLFVMLRAPLTRRNSLLLLLGVAAAGLAWGIWLRSLPEEMGYSEVPLTTMLIFGAGGLLIALAALFVASRRTSDLSAADLRLSGRVWVVLAFVGIAYFTLRLAQGALDLVSITVIAALLGFCVTMLWFQMPKKPRSLLDTGTPIRWFMLVTVAVLFLVLGVVGYNLPTEGDVDAFSALTVVFFAFGVVWLPTVSLVLGARAYARGLRAHQI